MIAINPDTPTIQTEASVGSIIATAARKFRWGV